MEERLLHNLEPQQQNGGYEFIKTNTDETSGTYTEENMSNALRSNKTRRASIIMARRKETRTHEPLGSPLTQLQCSVLRQLQQPLLISSTSRWTVTNKRLPTFSCCR